MSNKVMLLPLLTLMVTASGEAIARCDCSNQSWVGGCTATIKHDEKGVLVTSSSTQCSRVDWYLGSAPQVSVFWGGKEWEFVANGVARQSIAIESCRVCKDEKAENLAAREPRQVLDDAGQSTKVGNSDCDTFLERMAAIGASASIQNAEAGMRAMTALCGSVEACMHKMEACTR